MRNQLSNFRDKGLIGLAKILGVLLLTLCITVINWFDLLHLDYPDFHDIEVARYMLGRWPYNWEEVRKVGAAYYDGDDVMPERGGARPMHVVLESGPGDVCSAHFRFRNLIGFPYEESQTLTWSPEKARAIAADEWHNAFSRDLFDEYRERAREDHNGTMSSDTSGIADDLRFWNEDRPKIKSERVLQGVEGKRFDEVSPKTPCLSVTFTDGVRRVVLADGSVETT